MAAQIGLTTGFRVWLEIPLVVRRPDNNVLIRSGEALGIGWSRNMLYSGFNILHRSVVRRQTGFAARITRTLYASLRQFGIL